MHVHYLPPSFSSAQLSYLLPLHCLHQYIRLQQSGGLRSGKMQPREKVVVLKPVASRPFSSLRSFPKVLQDFNATCSPTITISEETGLIRPKATRLASLPGDLPTQIAASMDAGSDTISEEVEVYAEHFKCCDHVTACQTSKRHGMGGRLSLDGYNWRKLTIPCRSRNKDSKAVNSDTYLVLAFGGSCIFLDEIGNKSELADC